MRSEGTFNKRGQYPQSNLINSTERNWPVMGISRKVVIGSILMIALFAFEIFNFDTTQYALLNLLGDVAFMGLRWATILAIAFCAIDFAGLARLFTPERGDKEPKAVWYLMGAWLLGATMNAIMTWWAVSLTLLTHELGNEILGRDQLLQVMPIFVAALVWLTRILFIGSLSVTGEQIFDLARKDAQISRQQMPQRPVLARKRPTSPKRAVVGDSVTPPHRQPRPPAPPQTVRQQPPLPRPGPRSPAVMQAHQRRR